MIIHRLNFSKVFNLKTPLFRTLEKFFGAASNFSKVFNLKTPPI